MSAISGFCEKCNKFRKRHCDGNRNTCMSILFDTIEALQAENEQLQAQVARMREVLRKAREALEQTKGFIKGIGCYCNYEGEYASQCQPCFIVEQIDKALAKIDKAIGGAENGSSKDK